MGERDEWRIEQAWRDYRAVSDELDERRRLYATKLTRIALAVEVVLILAGGYHTVTNHTPGKLNLAIAVVSIGLLLFGLVLTPYYAEEFARKRVKPSPEQAREMGRLWIATQGGSDEEIERAMRPRGEP